MFDAHSIIISKNFVKTYLKYFSDNKVGAVAGSRSWLQHPAWGRFEELLTQMRLAALEHMAQAGVAEFPYWQGVVATLREIKERPHQIVAAALSVVEDEKGQRESVRTALDLADRVTIENDL
jgi:hypothetical protein